MGSPMPVREGHHGSFVPGRASAGPAGFGFPSLRGAAQALSQALNQKGLPGEGLREVVYLERHLRERLRCRCSGEGKGLI